MKIAKAETLRCDAGWRIYSFLKLTTDDGLVGWSEYIDGSGNRGLTAVIEALLPAIIGQDPLRFELIVAQLRALTRQSPGGLNHQAIAAIENALLDIKGKALGVPVYALFGGPVRPRIPVYCSHVGMMRARNAAQMGVPPLRSYDDLAAEGAAVKARGFTALKTNILPLSEDGFALFSPGFGRSETWPGLNWTPGLLTAARDTLDALRSAVGPDMEIMLDVNFHFRTEGFIRLADAVAPFALSWLEIDSNDAAALALVRQRAPCPIASCETLVGRREFRPFFEAQAVDVAIIDVPWNGLSESLKIAAAAETYDVNIAPHNFYGHLATMMGAHLGAVAPNLRTMEYDIEGVPWRDDFVTAVPVVENGELVLPDGPGWGIEVNEAAVRSRPPKR
jgi:L-alanine-DL-glutamate epimerase-like enolase superfamily enzyme